MVLGFYIRELRDRSKLSLRKLERASGVAWGTIHRTERNLRVCTLSELEGLARAWGLTTQDILGWANVEAKYPAPGCACQQKEGPSWPGSIPTS